MAGIKGQPGTKPSDLQSPVPAVSSGFDELDAISDDSFSELDTIDNEAALPLPEERGMFDVSAQGLAQGALDTLPTIGGMVGGGLGFTAGLSAGPGAVVAAPLGAVAGAAGGGALGQKLKTDLENLLFSQTKSRSQYYGDIKDAAVEQGSGEMLGLGIGGLAARTAKSKAATQIGKFVSEQLAAPMGMMKEKVGGLIDEIQAPLTKMLTSKASPLNTEQAGDAAKELLKKNIQGKYGPFIQAYSDLDSVSKAMPVADEARLKLTNKIKDWSIDFRGDDSRVIRQFVDDLNAAGNGASLDDVIMQIGDARQKALQSGATNLANKLKTLREMSTDFLEDETSKLALRVQNGKASPQEMQFLQQVVAKRGNVAPEDVPKYAKQLAKDFLTSKQKVKTDYAGFKSFLEDVGEQTKVGTKKRGPMTFLNAIDDVPSEKLIERMFDPKNAAALRRMQKETPEVFDQVVKSKMSEVMRASSPDGRLDLKAVRKAINKLPPSTREFLMSGDEYKIMNSVLDNPRLRRLEHLDKLGEDILMKWGGQVAEAAGIGAEKVVQGSANTLQKKIPSQIAGRTVNPIPPLLRAFGSNEEQ